MMKTEIKEKELRKRLKYNDDNLDNRKCVICGKSVTKYKNSDTCCTSCRSKLAYLTRGWRVTKVCPICGNNYNVTNSERNTITCNNIDCKKTHRSLKMSGKGNPNYGKLGKLSGHYEGGRFIDSKGYIRILMPKHPNANEHGYVHEHVLVMSIILGRALKKGEVVHHRDENRKNNEPSNLKLMTRSEHSKYTILKIMKYNQNKRRKL